jgi:hypothetical protein
VTARRVKAAKAAPLAEEAPEVEEVVTELFPYQVGVWHGIPNYKCPQCNFLTVQRDPAVARTFMAEHVEKKHPDSWLEGV